MQTFRFLPLVAVCLGLLLPFAAKAADVAVFAPEISNLTPQDASTVGELVAQAYASVSQQSVVSPSYAQSALVAAKTYEAAATQLAVREFIRLSAVAAGRRIVITAARYQADGRLLHQYRDTAEGLEGTTFAAESIARALFTGIAQPAVAPVVAPPIAGLAPPPKEKRKKDEVVYGLKTGVHMPLAKGATYYSAVSLQFNGRLQMPRFFLEFGAGFLIPTVIDDSDDDYIPCNWNPTTMVSDCPEQKRSNRGHVGGITMELGASYYLTQTNVAPYVGGGIIPRIVLAGLDQGNKEDIASMSAYVQFGLTFPRDRPTRFFFDLRLAQALLAQHLENGDQAWPTEPSLHAGIGW